MPDLNHRERIGPGDQPELVRLLDEGTPEEQCRALTLLCPCRNRVYSPEIWQRIVRACGSDEFQVKDRAHHALGTLVDRAQNDPRSRALLDCLDEAGDCGEDLLVSDRIAMWGPRSRPSRRKHMAPCRSGRPKATAFAQRQQQRKR